MPCWSWRYCPFNLLKRIQITLFWNKVYLMYNESFTNNLFVNWSSSLDRGNLSSCIAIIFNWAHLSWQCTSPPFKPTWICPYVKSKFTQIKTVGEECWEGLLDLEWWHTSLPPVPYHCCILYSDTMHLSLIARLRNSIAHVCVILIGKKITWSKVCSSLFTPAPCRNE